MRIIAGQWRGRNLVAPKGDNTRPTTDRIRESLMSSLNSQLGGFESLSVLDAFAGSGALGLEALSRGADCAVLCDNDPNALKAIQRNIALVNASESQVKVRKCDVVAHPPVNRTDPYDLVFLDPPYSLDSKVIMSFLDRLDDAGSLSADCLICYEHAKTDALQPMIEETDSKWRIVSSKSFGKTTTIDYLKRGSDAD